MMPAADDPRRRDAPEKEAEIAARVKKPKRWQSFRSTVLEESLTIFLDETLPARGRFDRGKDFAIAGIIELLQVADDEESEALSALNQVVEKIRVDPPRLSRGPQGHDFIVYASQVARQEIPDGFLAKGIAWADEVAAVQRLEDLRPHVLKIARLLVEKSILRMDMPMPEYEIDVPPEVKDPDA
jgi:hypothetical protein